MARLGRSLPHRPVLPHPFVPQPIAIPKKGLVLRSRAAINAKSRAGIPARRLLSVRSAVSAAVVVVTRPGITRSTARRVRAPRLNHAILNRSFVAVVAVAVAKPGVTRNNALSVSQSRYAASSFGNTLVQDKPPVIDAAIGKITIGLVAGIRNGVPLVVVARTRCDGIATSQLHMGVAAGERSGKPLIAVSTNRGDQNRKLVTGQTYLGLLSGNRTGKPFVAVPVGPCTYKPAGYCLPLPTFPDSAQLWTYRGNYCDDYQPPTGTTPAPWPTRPPLGPPPTGWTCARDTADSALSDMQYTRNVYSDFYHGQLTPTIVTGCPFWLRDGGTFRTWRQTIYYDCTYLDHPTAYDTWTTSSTAYATPWIAYSGVWPVARTPLSSIDSMAENLEAKHIWVAWKHSSNNPLPVGFSCNGVPISLSSWCGADWITIIRRVGTAPTLVVAWRPYSASFNEIIGGPNGCPLLTDYCLGSPLRGGVICAPDNDTGNMVMDAMGPFAGGSCTLNHFGQNCEPPFNLPSCGYSQVANMYSGIYGASATYDPTSLCVCGIQYLPCTIAATPSFVFTIGCVGSTLTGTFSGGLRSCN